MDDSLLNHGEQLLLLRWARQMIEMEVRRWKRWEIPEEEVFGVLDEPHGVFVTLKKRGELRGCIGKMDFERPLWRNTVEAAIASALEDPRFPPVAPEELHDLTIEISILNPPEDIAEPKMFDVSRHGIIVQKGLRHALLLPKVAQEQGWDATKTLEAVCEKAGLPSDAWRDPTTRLQVFTAFDFGEGKAAND